MAAVPSTVTSDSKLFGALCYIINIIVPLFVIFTDKKNDKFVAFHAYQALFIEVGCIVLLVIGLTVLQFGIAMDPSGMARGLIGFLSMGGYIVFGLLVLFSAFKAFTGEKFKLPVIGDMAEGYAGK